MAKSRQPDSINNPKFQKVVQTFLKTPPRQHRPLRAEPLRSGAYFLVVGDKVRIAHETSRNLEDGSITSDLYRNLEDYRSGRVMERGFTFWR